MDSRIAKAAELLMLQHNEMVQVVSVAFLEDEYNGRGEDVLDRAGRRPKKEWINEMFLLRDELGEFKLFSTLKKYPSHFKQYFRMTFADFDYLLNKLRPSIEKQETSFRKPIASEVRLCVALRYMATGNSFRSLSYSFRINEVTIGQIVNEVSIAVWTLLQPTYLKPPSTSQEWKSIAKNFYKQWNFPMCIGAIDGKHVRLQCPPKAGSEYYNYKGFHSLVLLAVCDANYRFTLVDVGDSGRHSDGGVFAHSEFGKQFFDDNLNIPNIGTIPGTSTNVPYCLVGDAAFPLRHNLMRPYPGKQLPRDKAIFNYRLSRSRRTIENTFGLLAARFRVFRKEMMMMPQKAANVTKATLVLHNFLQRNGSTSCSDVDHEDSHGRLIPGSWRKTIEGDSNLSRIEQQGSNNYTKNSAQIRDTLKEYFIGIGALPWQESGNFI